MGKFYPDSHTLPIPAAEFGKLLGDRFVTGGVTLTFVDSKAAGNYPEGTHLAYRDGKAVAIDPEPEMFPQNVAHKDLAEGDDFPFLVIADPLGL